jgi:hypothetical protein
VAHFFEQYGAATPAATNGGPAVEAHPTVPEAPTENVLDA